ncbi:hypothetical protein D3C85_1676750 [compost metagenome]
MMMAQYCSAGEVMPTFIMVPSAPMPAAMTTKPSVSVGLRPQRSTNPMAIKVASTLTRPTTTVPHICCAVLAKPARPKIFGA